MSQRYPLAVFAPNIGARSETFIARFMRDLLPGQTAVIAKNIVETSGAPLWNVIGPQLILSRLARPGLKKQVWHALAWQLGWEPDDPVQHAIRRFLAEHGVRAVLTNYLDESLLLLDAVLALGLRLVVHAHGYDISLRLREPHWRKEYLRLQRAHAIVVVSPHIRARLVELGLDGGRIHVVPAGTHVPSQPLSRAPGPAVRCLALGSMVPKKAPIMTLDAFRRARETWPHLTLDYVGGGPLFAAAYHFVRAFKLESCVTLHGPLPDDAVEALRREADIYLQHSMTDPQTGDEEGLPLTIAEMMAYSLPVVSTRHAGIPEAVEDGVTGCLVDEGDSAAMAEHIVRLARDPVLRQRLGVAGWQRARERFTWEQERGALLGLLDLG